MPLRPRRRSTEDKPLSNELEEALTGAAEVAAGRKPPKARNSDKNVSKPVAPNPNLQFPGAIKLGSSGLLKKAQAVTQSPGLPKMAKTNSQDSSNEKKPSMFSIVAASPDQFKQQSKVPMVPEMSAKQAAIEASKAKAAEKAAKMIQDGQNFIERDNMAEISSQELNSETGIQPPAPVPNNGMMKRKSIRDTWAVDAAETSQERESTKIVERPSSARSLKSILSEATVWIRGTKNTL